MYFHKELISLLKRKDGAFIPQQDLSKDFNANILRGPHF